MAIFNGKLLVYPGVYCMCENMLKNPAAVSLGIHSSKSSIEESVAPLGGERGGLRD